MRKILTTFILMVMVLGTVCAEESVWGIIATYEGSEVSYKFEDMPTVKYETVENMTYAVLYLNGVAEPVLSVALTEGHQLVMTYAEFTDGIDDVKSDRAVISERHGHKVIQGGRLIIIDKEGRRYNAQGVLLPQE